MTRMTAIVAAAGLALTTLASADTDWAAAVSGSWGVPANWSPADVPDTTLETATISVGPGAYTITIDGFSPALTTIAGLVLTNPAATFDIQGGKTLAITGGVLVNDGLVRIDSNNSTSDGLLRFDASALLSGAGTLRLVRNRDARLETGVGAVLTNTSRIEGGGVIAANLANAGVVEATPGLTLLLTTENKANTGTIGAAAGGLLQIDDITIDNTGGLIRAVDGTVQFPSGVHRVQSGNLASSGTGAMQVTTGSDLTLAVVTSTAQFQILGGGDIFVEGGMTNDGMILVDSNNSTSDSRLVFTSNGTLSGSGVLRLARNIDAIFDTEPGATVTIGAAQKIDGAGRIGASLVNNGVIEADVAGGVIEFLTNGKVNNALMHAVGGGTLNISSVTTNQSPAGVILADDGVVLVTSLGPTRVDGGALETMNGGSVRLTNGASLTLKDVAFSGMMDIEGGATVAVENSLANNGTIIVDSNNSTGDSVLTTVAGAIVTGSGLIRMNRNTDARIESPPGTTLTMGAGQEIRGGGVINAALVNNGLVDADTLGQVIDLRTEDKVNNATMRATLGTLDFTGVTIAQSASGTITADGGVVRTSSGSRIENGTLSTLNGGQVAVNNSAILTLKDVAFAGLMNIAGGATVAVENSLTNNGTIVVDSNNSSSDAVLSVEDGGSLEGTGVIQLNRATDARLGTPGTATLGAGQTVNGVGNIFGVWNIDGTIAPGVTVATITNSGTVNMQPTAAFDLELASTAAFDRLTGGGTVNIDGSLDISFLGYTQHKNDVFRFMTGSSITGRFAEVNGPALTDGLVYGVFYAPTFVELRIVCGPDLNLDAVIDFFDVLYFLQEYSAGNPDGDYNNDEVFDFFDVLSFLQAFAAGCP